MKAMHRLPLNRKRLNNPPLWTRGSATMQIAEASSGKAAVPRSHRPCAPWARRSDVRAGSGRYLTCALAPTQHETKWASTPRSTFFTALHVHQEVHQLLTDLGGYRRRGDSQGLAQYLPIGAVANSVRSNSAAHSEGHDYRTKRRLVVHPPSPQTAGEPTGNDNT